MDKDDITASQHCEKPISQNKAARQDHDILLRLNDDDRLERKLHRK